MAEGWVSQLAQRTTAPIHQDRQAVRGRAAVDLFLGRGRPGHGEFRRSDGPILNPCQLKAHGSQVGPLGRRSLQQLAARTALSGTNRVFYCRAGYCTRPPRSPPVGRGRHQRTQRPLPLRLSLAFKLHACRITPAGINCHPLFLNSTIYRCDGRTVATRTVVLLLVAMDANPASWLMTGHDEAKHLRRQAQVLMAKAFALNKSPTSKPPPVRCLAAARDGVFRHHQDEQLRGTHTNCACRPRAWALWTVSNRSPGLSPTGTPVARGHARLREVTPCGVAGVSPPNISRRRAPSACHGCQARHPWSTGMARASPCHRPRADHRTWCLSTPPRRTAPATFSVLATAPCCSTWRRTF